MSIVLLVKVYLGLDLAVVSGQNVSLLIVIELCNLLVIVTLLLTMPSITHIIHSSIKFAFPFRFPPQTTSVFTLTLDYQIDRYDPLTPCAFAVQWNVSGIPWESFYVRTCEPSLETN